tara:strand:- start:2560 stop:3183 length:624 start_codon:yes stop_codon:yes gene_type:complete
MKKKITQLKPNKNNPRLIKDSKFKKLVTSITQSPAFMELNPIKVDEDMRILGGNMRYKACLELKIKEVPINVFTKAHADINNIAREKNGIETATYEEQCNEFIIKDNVGYGEHDWDVLANSWDNKKLEQWGMDVWQPEEDVDYSALDDFNLGGELEDKEGNVKRAIQIEFMPEHYDEAAELISFFRERGANIGAMILEYLKAEKKKL